MNRSVGALVVIGTVLLGGSAQAAEVGKASWYSTECCKYNPTPSCPTASGKSLYRLEQQGVLFAAKWDVPLGSKFRVTNPKNGKSVVVVIEDRGPARRLNRAIDLSKAAYEAIGDLKTGVMSVTLEGL